MNIVVASRAQAERGRLPKRPFAVVSITDPGSSPAALASTLMLRGVLRLGFDDAKPGDEPPDEGQALQLMTEQDARAVWTFISGQRGVDTLVVQCEAGWSRSAAVAAAIAHAFGEEAEKYFRNYSPNEFVFRLMLRMLPSRLLRRRGS